MITVASSTTNDKKSSVNFVPTNTATCQNDAIQNPKTILFMPLDCVGHVNSLVSIADSLKHLGHRTVFLFYDPMDGGLKQKGHEIYDCSTEGLVPSAPTSASEEKWDMIVNEMGKLWRSSLMDNAIQTTRVGLGSMMKDIMLKDEIVQEKLKLIKPDLIVIDHYFIQPALAKYGCPWARVFSASPLNLHPYEHNLPPATLGFPTKWLETSVSTELENYKYIQKEVQKVAMDLYETFNDFVTKQHGLKDLPKNPISYIHMSPWLNVYMYPEELDYNELGLPALKDWVRCDSILRINSKLPKDLADEITYGALTSAMFASSSFELPKEFERKSGKLIFLSMGSLASGDVALMTRLVKILRKSPHKFIVSRGANWDKYELAHNMWGEKFLPQLDILQKIDLIITHGGNNTITECFYFGVPGFVVCPVFSDQYDNAQRIEEMGLGKRVDPFHCSDEDLLSAIESVLNDPDIARRMTVTKDRMQLAKNKYKAIRLFKDLVDKLDDLKLSASSSINTVK